ncbi:MAG: hypothetical protein ABSG65_32250 [Bryobacteraceae bacterium]
MLQRIVFLASLREPDTCQYGDRAIEELQALKFGEAGIGRVRSGEQVVGLP